MTPEFLLTAAQVSFAIIIGIPTYIIARRQWLTAHNRLKLDLFDRRWAIYEGTTQFAAKTFRDFKPTNDDFSMLWKLRTRAQPLFEAEVTDAMKELNDTAAALRAEAETLEGVPVGPERNEIVERRRLLIEMLHGLHEKLPKLFDPYLDFRKLR